MLRNNNLSCRSVEVECLSKSVVSSSCWLHHPVDYCRGFGGLFCVVCCCVSYVSQFLTCRGALTVRPVVIAMLMKKYFMCRQVNFSFPFSVALFSFHQQTRHASHDRGAC